ncbi:hypothetical protein B2J93_4053 [Marssonina coronariae]|uniref:Uncharacterized protein n=1 Tax=Diplocarpon coronariae TaxID=2795749 RepID=A0A218Z9L2_9HELO|nr:hypothetical protein B2J93_4053 [Marssonina coronariae]
MVQEPEDAAFGSGEASQSVPFNPVSQVGDIQSFSVSSTKAPRERSSKSLCLDMILCIRPILTPYGKCTRQPPATLDSTTSDEWAPHPPADIDLKLRDM